MDTRIFSIYISLFIFYGLLISTQGISKVDDFLSSVRNATDDLRRIRMVTEHFGKTFSTFDNKREKRDLDETDALFGIHNTNDELNSNNENFLLEDSPLSERQYFLFPELEYKKYKKDKELSDDRYNHKKIKKFRKNKMRKHKKIKQILSNNDYVSDEDIERTTDADNDYGDSDYDDNDYRDDIIENDVSHEITSQSPSLIPRTKSNHHTIVKSFSTTIEPEPIQETNKDTINAAYLFKKYFHVKDGNEFDDDLETDAEKETKSNKCRHHYKTHSNRIQHNRGKEFKRSNRGNRFTQTNQEHETTPNFLLNKFNKIKNIFHKTHKPVESETQFLNESRTDINDDQTTSQPESENPLSNATTPTTTTEMVPMSQDHVKRIHKRFKNFGSSNRKTRNNNEKYGNKLIQSSRGNKQKQNKNEYTTSVEKTPIQQYHEIMRNKFKNSQFEKFREFLLNDLYRESKNSKKSPQKTEQMYEDFINDYLSSDKEINYLNAINGLSTNDRTILKLIKKKLHYLHDSPPPNYYNFSKPLVENKQPIKYQDQSVSSKNDLSHEAYYKLSRLEQDAMEREAILNFSSPLSKWPTRFLDNNHYNVINPSTTPTPFQKALQKNIRKILRTHSKNLKNQKFNINDLLNPAQFITSRPNQQVTPLSQQQSYIYNYIQDKPMRRSIDPMQEVKLKVSSRLQSRGYGPSLPSDFLEKSYSNYDLHKLFNFKNNNKYAAENNDYEFDKNQNDYDYNYDYYDYNDVNEVGNINHKFSKKSISLPKDNRRPQLQNDILSTTFRIGRHSLQDDYDEILFDEVTDNYPKTEFSNKSEKNSQKNKFDNKNDEHIQYFNNKISEKNYTDFNDDNVGNTLNFITEYDIEKDYSDIRSEKNTKNPANENGIENDYSDVGSEKNTKNLANENGIENDYSDIGPEGNLEIPAIENGIENDYSDIGPEDSANEVGIENDYSDIGLEENENNLANENEIEFEYADVKYIDTNKDMSYSAAENGNINGYISNNLTNESIQNSSEDFVDLDLGVAENNTFSFDANVYSKTEKNIPFSLKNFVNTELAHVKNLTHSTNNRVNSDFEKKKNNTTPIEEYINSDFGQEENSQNPEKEKSFKNDYSDIEPEENIKNSAIDKVVQNNFPDFEYINTSEDVSYSVEEPEKNAKSKDYHVKPADNISNSTNNNLTKENILTNKSVNSNFEQKENNASSIEEYICSDFELEENIPSSIDEYVSRDFEYAENNPYSIDENGNPDVVPEESITNLVQRNINHNFRCKFNISNSTIENDYPNVTLNKNNVIADNYSVSEQEENVSYSTNKNKNNDTNEKSRVYNLSSTNYINNDYYNIDSEEDSSVDDAYTNDIISKNCAKDNQAKTASKKMENKKFHTEPDRNSRLSDYPNILVNKNINDDVYSANNFKYPFKNNDLNHKHLITEPKIKLDKVFDNYETIEKTNDILLNHLPIKPSDAKKIYDMISPKKHDILDSLKIQDQSLKNKELLNLTKLITETILQMSNETTTNNTNNVQEKSVLVRNSSNQNETESNEINLKLNVSIDATILSNDSKIFNLTGMKYNRTYKKSKRIDPDDDDLRRKRRILFPNMESMNKFSKKFRMRSKDDSLVDESLNGQLSSDIVSAVYEMVNKDDRLRTYILPGLRKQKKSHNKGLKGLNTLRTKGNKDKIKRNEKMFKQVVDSINMIIEQQVSSRSCLHLDEDLQEFYDLILRTRRQIYSEKARTKRNRRKNIIELNKKLQEIEKNHRNDIPLNYMQLIKRVEILNENNSISNKSTSDIKKDEKK